MLKGICVIASLGFCAIALVVPPTARGAAAWSVDVLRSASRWGQSALSVVQEATPSRDEIVRHVGTTRALVESFAANVLSSLREPQPTAPAGPQLPVAAADMACSGAELSRAWCDARVQAALRLVEEERARRGESAPPPCGQGQPASATSCK
jgi:hypothetical protein